MRSWRQVGVVVVLLAWSGCARKLPTAVHTGAEDAARSFCVALVQMDWPQAFRVLAPDSRVRVPEAQFAQRAGHYLNSFGFAAQEVFIRACDERGPEATAQVRFRGHAKG